MVRANHEHAIFLLELNRTDQGLFYLQQTLILAQKELNIRISLSKFMVFTKKNQINISRCVRTIVVMLNIITIVYMRKNLYNKCLQVIDLACLLTTNFLPRVDDIKRHIFKIKGQIADKVFA